MSTTLEVVGYRPRLGAVVHDAAATFRVWAPAQRAVAVVFEDGREAAMAAEPGGYFAVTVDEVRPGQRYWYRLAQGLRPDPASRFQPEGPLGPSQVVDPRAFPWSDAAWPGAPAPHRHVLYEMHIGTFTDEGTWRAAARQLPFLRDVGITTLEIMPIAEFNGRFGWGYDCVQWFAPTRLYGGPDDVRHFVDGAHQCGLAVILDVVYNHFGPVGNFIAEFSETALAEPGEWGDSLNFDAPGSEGLRALVRENAAYWIAEYHFDGLRLDATHAIADRSEEHIVSELARAARQAAGSRRVFITSESEPQDTSLLKGASFPDGVDATWNEDWHHAAFVVLTGRRQAYFTDYQGTAAEFAAMARHGTLYQGQWYSWQKKGRGGFSRGLPGCAFVNFLENHDQIANTGLGWRLYQRSSVAQWRAMTALLLLGPNLPMLFQGQEFGSSRLFAYFADHEPELAEKVQQGRAEFLAQFPSLQGPAIASEIPAPHAESTFFRSKLLDAERRAHTWAVNLHRDLLQIRRDDPVISIAGTHDVTVDSAAPTSQVIVIRYSTAEDERLLVVNLGDDYVSPMNDPIFAPRPGREWTVQWASENPAYGGSTLVPFTMWSRWLLMGRTAVLLRSAASAQKSRDMLR